MWVCVGRRAGVMGTDRAMVWWRADGHGLWSDDLALAHTSNVSSGKLLNLSGPHFSHPRNEIIIFFKSQRLLGG